MNSVTLLLLASTLTGSLRGGCGGPHETTGQPTSTGTRIPDALEPPFDGDSASGTATERVAADTITILINDRVSLDHDGGDPAVTALPAGQPAVRS